MLMFEDWLAADAHVGEIESTGQANSACIRPSRRANDGHQSLARAKIWIESSVPFTLVVR